VVQDSIAARLFREQPRLIMLALEYMCRSHAPCWRTQK